VTPDGKQEEALVPDKPEEPIAKAIEQATMANPYSAALLSGSFISPAAEQHKLNVKKAKGKEAAEEKRRAEERKAQRKLENVASRESQTTQEQQKKQAQPQGKQQGKGQPGKGQNQPAKAQPQQQPAQPKSTQQPTPQATKPPAPQVTKPTQQQTKSTPTTKQSPQKAGPTKVPPKVPGKSQSVVPSEGVQPIWAVLAVVGLLAFGYVFMFGSA